MENITTTNSRVAELISALITLSQEAIANLRKKRNLLSKTNTLTIEEQEQLDAMGSTLPYHLFTMDSLLGVKGFELLSTLLEQVLSHGEDFTIDAFTVDSEFGEQRFDAIEGYIMYKDGYTIFLLWDHYGKPYIRIYTRDLQKLEKVMLAWLKGNIVKTRLNILRSKDKTEKGLQRLASQAAIVYQQNKKDDSKPVEPTEVFE